MSSTNSLSVIKCFSILVAAGKGHRCNQLKNILSDTLLQQEQTTGLSKGWIFKYGRNEHPDLHLKFRQEIAQECNDLYLDVPSYVFLDGK